MKQLLIALIALCSAVYTINAQNNATATAVSAAGVSGSREQDGLSGPVRRVRVETANIVTRDGKQVELPRTLIQVSTYDPLGRKTDSVAYPVEGASAPGKEEYKYDDKGNIIEMTLRGNEGAILSKEKYTYEFDEFGNWKKMTAALAIYENGNLTYEPTEITYRSLTYYYGPATSKTSVATPSVAAKPPVKTADASEKPIENKVTPSQPANVSSAPTENASEKVVPTEAKRDTAVPVLRISEDVLRKAAIELPEPPYPADASLAGAGGQVQVELIIDQNGNVTTARATSGNPLLYQAATSAANKSRFMMSAFSDHPTNAYSVLTYNFERPAAVASNPPSSAPVVPTVEKKSEATKASLSTEKPRTPEPASNSKSDSNDTNPQSFAAYFNKGLASIASTNYDDAVQSLTQAITLNPQDALAFAKLGVAYSALGQHKPAITAFKQAIKLNRAFVDADSYFRFGSSYIALTDYATAIDPLKQALYSVKAKQMEGRTNSGGPSETEVQHALGLAYYGTGSYRQATKAFEAAVQLNPNFASAHYGLGLCYLEIGDKRSAEKEAEILRKLKSPLANRLTGMLVIPAGQRNKIF